MGTFRQLRQRGARTLLCVVGVIVVGSCGAHNAPTTQAKTDRNCVSIRDCESLVRSFAGVPLLVPSNPAVTYQDGSVALRFQSASPQVGSHVADLHFADSKTHRSFFVNVYLGTDLSCPKSTAEVLTVSPRGKRICFVHDSAGHDVDIRYAANGLEYVFSYFNPNVAQGNEQNTHLGRWAIATVDSLRSE